MIDKMYLIFQKHKEVIMYIIFGVATTAVNWICYSILVAALKININISNTIAWVCAVLFAYVTNKLWVFESKSWNLTLVCKECVSFFSGRIFSGIFEIVSLPILVYLGLNQALWGVDCFLAKVLVGIVVIILNYIISKWIVFKASSYQLNNSQVGETNSK